MSDLRILRPTYHLVLRTTHMTRPIATHKGPHSLLATRFPSELISRAVGDLFCGVGAETCSSCWSHADGNTSCRGVGQLMPGSWCCRRDDPPHSTTTHCYPL